MPFKKYTGSEKIEVMVGEKLTKLSSFLRKTGKTAAELTDEEKAELQRQMAKESA